MAFRQRETCQFCSCFSLTKGQRSKRYTLLSVLAVRQPFYISICISILCLRITLRLFTVLFFYEVLMCSGQILQLYPYHGGSIFSGEAMINKTLVMLTTDHGGYRSSHAFCQYLHNKTLFPDSNICASYFMPSVMEIPVLLQGKIYFFVII